MIPKSMLWETLSSRAADRKGKGTDKLIKNTRKMKNMNCILASGSRRRGEILTNLYFEDYSGECIRAYIKT